MENLNYQRFICLEENNQQPLLSHPPPRPPSLVQNLHPVPVTCPSGEQNFDQSTAASSVGAGLDHDTHCALSTLNSRRNNTTNRQPSENANNAEVAQESVDLLRMLPEACTAHVPRESNPRRANRMYGGAGTQSGAGSGGGGGAGSHANSLQSGLYGTAGTGTQNGTATQSHPGVHREAEESAAEDSSGFCDDSVVYYTNIPCTHGSSGRIGGLGGLGGSSSGGAGAGSDPEERIAFLSSTYSTLNRTKRNNGGVSMIEDRSILRYTQCISVKIF